MSEETLSRAAISYRKRNGIPLDKPKATLEDLRQSKIKYVVNGEPAVDIARKNGISVLVFRDRLRNGWTVENACTVPTHRKSDVKDSVSFANNLFNELKDNVNKSSTDYEKILHIEVCKRCIHKRWETDEKTYHLTHNFFKRINNYIKTTLIELDISDDVIEKLVNANIDMINSRVEKNYDKYFSDYEKRKMIKWQNR